MDLKHPTTKIPEPESDTPPLSQPTKLLSYSFPTGKPHHHHHHPPPSTAVAYRECLKNHAAAIGGHAVDGCGEFMPSLTCTATEPKSLKCAACGCHRNFHRREPTTDFPPAVTRTHFIDFHRPYQTSTSTSTSPSPPSPPPQPTNYAFGGHLLLSLSTAAEQTHTAAPLPAIKISGRKRFRTKFSQDQKEKMMIFAQRIGWKMQRCDDKKIVDFCNEIGIRRGIFKVWMHNNKNTFGKREKDTTTANESSHQENGSGDVHLQDSTNGSSSSS